MKNVNWPGLRKTITAAIAGALAATLAVMIVAVTWATLGGPPVGFSEEAKLQDSLKSAIMIGPMLAGFAFSVMLIVYWPITLIFRRYSLKSFKVHVVPFVLLVFGLALMESDLTHIIASAILIFEKTMLCSIALSLFWLIRRPDLDSKPA